MTQQKQYDKLRKIKNDLEIYLDEQVTKEVHIILPANICKDYLVTHKPEDFSKDRWLSGCYYIIHSILQLSIEKRNFKSRSNLYVPLFSKILKETCGYKYNEFVDKLISLSIIECDGKYSKMKHESFGFRLSNKYREQKIKNETIEYKNIKDAILRNRAKRLAEMKIKIRPIAHLARWSVDPRLEINKKNALEYLDSYRIWMLKEITKRNLLPKYVEKEKTFVNARFYRAVSQIENWGNSPTLTVDDSGGRLYTRITGLMSPLRNFLTYDGKSLVSFDIKNSQPLHLLLLMNQPFWNKGQGGLTLERLNKDLLDYLKEEIRNSTRSSIMFPKSLETLADKGSEITDFRFLVEHGKLYEFISMKLFNSFKNCNDSDSAKRFSTRNKTKSEVLKLMYFNPKERFSKSQNPFEKFAILFPEVARLMTMLKKRNYKDFSILLQKLEAQILLHNVCRKVYDKNSNIPLFTVHDSIITTEEFTEDLNNILIETYTEIFGFTPTFKKELLSDSTADGEKLIYIKGKIDQAEIEIISEDEPIMDIFPFLECENFNIINELEEIKKTSYIFGSFTNNPIYHPPVPYFEKRSLSPFTNRKLKK